jgi:hypothetical protein
MSFRPEPATAASPAFELPWVERFGLAVLRRATAHAPVAGADDPIYVLNADEQRELRRIERRAVLRAAAAGGLSGAATAAAAIWAHRYIGPDGNPLSAGDGARFWFVVLAVTVVASIACRRTLSLEAVERLRRAFKAGRGLDFAHVKRLVDVE